jgi:hypothetical protein
VVPAVPVVGVPGGVRVVPRRVIGYDDTRPGAYNIFSRPASRETVRSGLSELVETTG